MLLRSFTRPIQLATTTSSVFSRHLIVRYNHSHSHGHDHDHSHSHKHAHSHSSADSVLAEQTGGLKNPAIRITWVGLIANVGMAVGKGVGGVVFHSQALIADSMHAVSDLFSDFLTLATVSLGTRTPTASFPNGYGRIESLGSLGVSALLLFAGVSMGWSSGLTMIQSFGVLEQLPDWLQIGHSHSHSHSHGHDHAVTDINAAWLALGSIFIKEWLYRATMKVSKQMNSPVLVANAWHHRIDSLVSIVAVATIAGGHLWHVPWMDPLGGLIVSTMIVRAGWTTTKAACLELADCNERMEEEIEPHRDMLTDILRDEQLDMAINKIDLMPSGPNYTAHIELQLQSTSSRSLKDIHDTIVAKLFDNNKRLRKVTLTIL